MTPAVTSCPACFDTNLELIRVERGIPTNSCLLLDDHAAAIDYPTGDHEFTLCRACGFCFNATFDARLAEYSARYEETQGFSPRFGDFATELASRWVDEYDLAGSTVLEIGCGSMGEFLQLMVEAGVGHGIGVDPALETDRIHTTTPDRFTWIADFYGDDHTDFEVDAIICRHTLEHIAPVHGFISDLRRTIGDRDLVVLFELPDVGRVLREGAFWDVYYEHCSYFSSGSLARLFRRTGFDVEDIRLEYDDQYVTLAAHPAGGPTEPCLREEDDLDQLITDAAHYRRTVEALVAEWRGRIDRFARDGLQPVVWGGGSKGVSFLTNVASPTIEYAVDVNPTKQGRFMAGSGREIVGPAFLDRYEADVVIAMNPIYVDEIAGMLSDQGLHPTIIGI